MRSILSILLPVALAAACGSTSTNAPVAGGSDATTDSGGGRTRAARTPRTPAPPRGRRRDRRGLGRRPHLPTVRRGLRLRRERVLRANPGRPGQLRRLRARVSGGHVLLGGIVRGDVHRTHVGALLRDLRRYPVRQQELRRLRAPVSGRAGLLRGRVRAHLRDELHAVRGGCELLLRRDADRPGELRRLRHRLPDRRHLLGRSLPRGGAGRRAARDELGRPRRGAGRCTPCGRGPRRRKLHRPGGGGHVRERHGVHQRLDVQVRSLHGERSRRRHCVRCGAQQLSRGSDVQVRGVFGGAPRRQRYRVRYGAERVPQGARVRDGGVRRRSQRRERHHVRHGAERVPRRSVLCTNGTCKPPVRARGWHELEEPATRTPSAAAAAPSTRRPRRTAASAAGSAVRGSTCAAIEGHYLCTGCTADSDCASGCCSEDPAPNHCSPSNCAGACKSPDVCTGGSHCIAGTNVDYCGY